MEYVGPRCANGGKCGARSEKETCLIQRRAIESINSKGIDVSCRTFAKGVAPASPLEDGRGGEGGVALWVQRRGGRARAWPGRYIIREQRTSVPYNQNSAAAEAIFLSADVMDRWTDAGGRGTDGLTQDETEKRKTEEVKKLSGEIGATKEQKIFIQMHAPPLL